jgi:hypothetical protein
LNSIESIVSTDLQSQNGYLSQIPKLDSAMETENLMMQYDLSKNKRWPLNLLSLKKDIESQDLGKQKSQKTLQLN